MDRTKIQWTDATWNPIRGCSRVSEGCRNCYAEAVAARFSDPGMAYEGLARRTPGGPRWTGEVRVVEKHLGDPLRWRRPRRVFVNSMSDIFHEALSDYQIACVFEVMEAASQHVFQILTKRPPRMRDFFRTLGDRHRFSALPNVWLGVSVEDQASADARIPVLLDTPAAVRWISAEPLLGPIDLRWLRVRDGNLDALAGRRSDDFSSSGVPDEDVPRLGWVVVGGESGPGARPCHVEWLRSIVAQCRAAGVAAFTKQLGAHVLWYGVSGPGEHWPDGTERRDVGGAWRVLLRDKKGGEMSEFPEDLRVREFPGEVAVA